jgi:hypothetical protein
MCLPAALRFESCLPPFIIQNTKHLANIAAAFEMSGQGWAPIMAGLFGPAFRSPQRMWSSDDGLIKVVAQQGLLNRAWVLHCAAACRWSWTAWWRLRCTS